LSETGGNRQEERPHESDPKPVWLRVLESATVAALLTGLVGGVLVQIITASFQRSAGRREFNDAWLKARGDQALTGYREYQHEQFSAVDRVYSEVGEMISAGEAVISAANWDRRRKETNQYVIGILKHFNDREDSWVKSKPRFTFLLSYYSSGNEAIPESWSSVARGVDAYRECVSSWYEEPHGQFPFEAICGVQRQDVDVSLRTLGRELERSRSYVWHGWDNPRELRKALDIPSD
jgi:hypothetical protein